MSRQPFLTYLYPIYANVLLPTYILIHVNLFLPICILSTQTFYYPLISYFTSTFSYLFVPYLRKRFITPLYPLLIKLVSSLRKRFICHTRLLASYYLLIDLNFWAQKNSNRIPILILLI